MNNNGESKMRKLMTLLVAALLIQVPGAVRAADEDIFSFALKPNVLDGNT